MYRSGHQTNIEQFSLVSIEQVSKSSNEVCLGAYDYATACLLAHHIEWTLEGTKVQESHRCDLQYLNVSEKANY